MSKGFASRTNARRSKKNKTARLENVKAYYKRFRNGKNRHNPDWTGLLAREKAAKAKEEV